MIEQGFNYSNSAIKEITEFFETTKENLEPRENKKNPSFFRKRKIRKATKSGK